MTKAVTRSYFATQIHECTIIDPAKDAEFIEDLIDGVVMLAEGDEAGQQWCEEQGYLGYTSYASLNDLPQRISAFGKLEKRLVKAANAYAKELGFELGSHKLSMNSFWVNVLDPGAGHSGHIHPNSVLSGTFYLDLPEGASAIRFEDPRLPFMMNSPPQKDDIAADLKRFIYFQPQVGQALFWESWLRHEVLVNMADEPRLSISFNLS
ncbi:TIGR02466 family protein [Ponticaulis sp.]|uniref:TIGR02466 family protein n=1 Tax=Ponticaulis sp. TaxID=2020902 RepID=UPI002601B376|nr:TIGR02466 family protein [Ponticaulis sp.]MDF1680634.1 TIGR02466 family protein [Ponticaulis sp.]